MLIVSECGAESPQVDYGAGELEESLVEVGAYLVADAQALELVQPPQGSLYHPTGLAQA